MKPDEKTVLVKMGISDEMVRKWKGRGLVISYPMRRRNKFLISKDGPMWVESADKFVPPLSQEETAKYIKSPEKFRTDFMRNVKFYFEFHRFLYKQADRIKSLETQEERLIAGLALLYLFQSAMDHHHYHFDRYLGYEDYPETPVGYWWQRLKDLFGVAVGRVGNKAGAGEKFLQLLGGDKEVLGQVKEKLTTSEWREFQKAKKAVKMFEEAQQQAGEIISGFPAKEDLLLKTGFALWNRVVDLVNNQAELMKPDEVGRMRRLVAGHPILATRELLISSELVGFKPMIVNEFKREIERWKA